MGLKLNHILNFGLGLGFELEPWLLASASLFDGLALRAAGLDPCFVKKCWCISHNKVSVCCWPSFTTARNLSCAWSKSVWSFFHRFATIEFPIWPCRAMFQYKKRPRSGPKICLLLPLCALVCPCLSLPPLASPCPPFWRCRLKLRRRKIWTKHTFFVAHLNWKIRLFFACSEVPYRSHSITIVPFEETFTKISPMLGESEGIQKTYKWSTSLIARSTL